MVIIGKIQEKGCYLFVGFVGFVLFIFIFFGFFKVGGGLFSGNIGIIDGEVMDYNVYVVKVDLFVQNDVCQVQQQGCEFFEKDIENICDCVWQVVVDEIFLNKEMDVFGLEVIDKEFNFYFYGEDGFMFLLDIQQVFIDFVIGKFNLKVLDCFIEECDNFKDLEQIKQWDDMKKSICEQCCMEKYFQLMCQGVYVIKFEVKVEYIVKNEQKFVFFVMKNYCEIDDKVVKISDVEIEKYYEVYKNEKKYELCVGCEVCYFDV